MRKFFNGYYGAAGPYLIKYIDFLTETITRKNFKLHYYSDRVSGWLSYDEVLEAEKIYAAAEEAVKDDPTCAKRVRRERIPLDLVRLMYATENGKAKRFLKEKAAPIPENIMQLADEFVELTKNAGQYREGKAMGTYPDMIRNNLRQAIAPVTYVPEICKGKPLDSWDVFPAKGHRLHLGSCKLVNDPEAAVGQAIQMPGNTNEWGTQIPFPVQFYNADKQWKLVVRVRCDAAADDGNALSFGIYGTKLFFLTERVPVKQCKGQKYAVVETKPFSLKPLEGKNPFVWCAPPNRPLEEVAAVYIDEAILMQAE
jgi:hypothetical protein